MATSMLAELSAQFGESQIIKSKNPNTQIWNFNQNMIQTILKHYKNDPKKIMAHFSRN